MQPNTINSLRTVLAEYLAAKLPSASNVRITSLERAAGGSSRAMWFFDADWDGEAGIPKTLTFRADESNVFRDSEYSLKREYDVHKILEATDIPVVPNFWYEDDPRWVGEPFVIRERVEDAEVDFAPLSAERRLAVLEDFVDVMARWHTLDWKTKGLSFLGAPDAATPTSQACAARLLDTWENVVRREAIAPHPVMTAGMAWLRANLPTGEGRISLNQGQVGPGQFLFRGERVIAVLDWEQAFLGDPMSDIAYFSITTSAMLGDQLPALLDRYTRKSGIPIEHDKLKFYTVFQSYWALAACITAHQKVDSGQLRRNQTFALGAMAQVPFKRILLGAIAGAAGQA